MRKVIVKIRVWELGWEDKHCILDIEGKNIILKEIEVKIDLFECVQSTY